MYVKIGPYTPWWVSKVYSRYMDKKYNYDWDEPTTTFEKFLDKLEDALQWVYSHTVNPIFARMKRKIKVRIDDYDVWGMDNTLAHIIYPMLVKLRGAKHGAPNIDDEDVPDELKSTAAEPKKNKWDTDSNHFKRWDWIMNEMIYAFEKEIDEEWDMEIYKREPEGWDDAKFAQLKVIQTRISNGFRFFGKYYQALWD